MPDYSDTKSEGGMAIGSTTAKMASSIFIVKAFTFLFLGLVFIAIIRLLGPSPYGVYTLAIASAGFFGAFGDLGVGTMFVKFIPQYLVKKQNDKIKSLLVNGFSIIIVETLVFTILAIALSGFVAQSVLHDPTDTVALQIAALTIILGTLWGTCYNVLIGFGKSANIVITVIVQIICQGVFSLVLVLLGFGALGPIIGLVTSEVVGIIYGASVVVRISGIKLKAQVMFAGWKKILKFSLPISAASAVSTLITNFSFFILGFYSTSVVLGNFGAAYKAINIFDVVLGSIGLALLPFFSVTFSDKRITRNLNKYYNYSIYFAYLFAIPIIFYVVVLAQPFSYTIFSGIYTTAPLYLSVMAIGTALILIYSYTSSLLISAGKVMKVLKYNIIICIIQAILLPVFVEPLSGLGLVLLMFIVIPIIYNILYINRARKSFNITIDFGMLWRVTISGIISALFIIPLALLLSGNDIPLLIAAAVEQIILYPIIVSLLRGVDKQRLELIRRVTSGIPLIGYIMRLLIDYANMFAR